MKTSSANELLPATMRRALARLGADIRLARRKRSLTVRMMMERIGVAKTTYLKVEKGDPTVAMATYAMALYVLGLGDALGQLADARQDDTGLMLDARRVPQRIRPSKGLQPL